MGKIQSYRVWIEPRRKYLFICHPISTVRFRPLLLKEEIETSVIDFQDFFYILLTLCHPDNEVCYRKVSMSFAIPRAFSSPKRPVMICKPTGIPCTSSGSSFRKSALHLLLANSSLTLFLIELVRIIPRLIFHPLLSWLIQILMRNSSRYSKSRVVQQVPY